MSASATLTVEVAYARPEAQSLRVVHLVAGASAADAVRASGLLETYPEIPWPDVALGVFSRKVGPEYRVEDGDRVEIYRPLTVDPKERRRARAK